MTHVERTPVVPVADAASGIRDGRLGGRLRGGGPGVTGLAHAPEPYVPPGAVRVAGAVRVTVPRL
ncbi:hypothetical protein AB0I02_20230 [Streptomyces phaeochromogenes]